MNKERLSILRDALLSISEDRKFQDKVLFDYSFWAERENNALELGDCGTSACALGLCPLLFPNQFKVEWMGRGTGSVQLAVSPYIFGLSAAKEFFGLSYEEAGDIFNGRYYNSSDGRYCSSDDVSQFPLHDITPKMVADRIDEYLQR